VLTGVVEQARRGEEGSTATILGGLGGVDVGGRGSGAGTAGAGTQIATRLDSVTSGKFFYQQFMF